LLVPEDGECLRELGEGEAARLAAIQNGLDDDALEQCQRLAPSAGRPVMMVLAQNLLYLVPELAGDDRVVLAGIDGVVVRVRGTRGQKSGIKADAWNARTACHDWTGLGTLVY
jgi:hypothetical protein